MLDRIVRSIFFLCVLQVSFVYAATSGKISGTVIDDATGDPLPGANVIIDGTSQGAATDAEGDFFIVNVPPGSYNVTVTMIGYEALTVTDVLVISDHTTPMEFNLTTDVVELEGIVVEATREVIKMDRSASAITVQADQIENVPAVADLEDYLNQQVGIENMMIRGGGLDQTEFIMDGMTIVDRQQNRPLHNLVNLSAIEELTIIKGGFNAEYGNIRSGLISVVTKDGAKDAFHGSVDFRYSPPQMKTSSPAIGDTMNYFLRPYFDPDVAFVGTANGTWDATMQNQYPEFEGWNSLSERYLSDEDPSNDQTPKEAKNLFMWQHATEGSDRLGQRPLKSGHLPDYIGDFSLSGPVPVVGKLLGDMTFFASYRNQQESYAMPTARDYYTENNAHIKLTSQILPRMKVRVEVISSQMESIQAGGENASSAGDFFRSGYDILARGASSISGYGRLNNIFWPASRGLYDVSMDVVGATLDHALSDKTFYSIRGSYVTTNYKTDPYLPSRDTAIKAKFGAIEVDEWPYGYEFGSDFLRAVDGMSFGTVGNDRREDSNIETINLKFDLTSQINKYHQLKIGVLVNTDVIHPSYAGVSEVDFTRNYTVDWVREPLRYGGYIQDKLEWEGMIANIGLRLDYHDPNTEWYFSEDDPFSEYFSRKHRDVFQDVAPTYAVDRDLKISPRLGISHPITDKSKLYFNYGHFHSMAPTIDMFNILPGRTSSGIVFLGNPEAKMPRTIAYELGYERDIGDQFLLHVASYYKDISNEAGNVTYRSYDRSVDYATVDNNHYGDIRGIEIRLDKRYGRWLTGWFNYDYRVETSGFTGREVYFEDPREQALYGLMNPYQERPLARPLARGNIRVTVPDGLGPEVGGIDLLGGLQFNLLYFWKAGRYETWDPLSTLELVDNLQWTGEQYFDLRLEKSLNLKNANMRLFADIKNVFDHKYIHPNSFGAGSDRNNYLGSLHLDMYNDDKYKNAGFTGGSDKPGEVNNADYVDQPNMDVFRHLFPRFVTFGLKVSF